MAALSIVPVGLADEWETAAGGNSARNGASAEVGPASPDLLWSGSRPAIVSQQAAIGEGLVVLSRIENFTIPTGTWIVAHDLNTGAVRWETRLPQNFSDSWRSKTSAVRNGQVYATRAGNTNLEYMYALSAVDGSIVWESEDLIDEATTESLAFAENGDLVVGNFRSVTRINWVDGTTVWDTPRSSPTTNGSQVAVFGDRVYGFEAGAFGPTISVWDANTGNFLYESDGIGGGFAQQLGPLVGPDGTVYAPRTQNNPVTDFLVAYEDTGSALVEKWRRPLAYIPFGTLAVGPDGSVYSYRPTGTNTQIIIERLDPADGSLIDESAVLATDFVQPRIAVDAVGNVYFTNGGFSSGRFYALTADLQLLWDLPVSGVNVGGPALGPDGTLVFCGTGTNVRAYRVQDELVVNAPEPGLAGQRNVIRVRGATPGGRVAVVYGLRAGTAPVPNCGGLTVDIANPTIAGILTADANGKATLAQSVPPQAAGVTIYLQAVEPSPGCVKSPRVMYTFPSNP